VRKKLGEVEGPSLRKKLGEVDVKTLHEALEGLGYRKTRETPATSEWRRQWLWLQFHVTVAGRKNRLNLQVHIDEPISIPPYHRAVHHGITIARELDKILGAYRMRRLKRDVAA